MSESVFMGRPPAAFVDAVVARVEREVLPDLPPELATGWRSNAWSWVLIFDQDMSKPTVEVSVTTIEGVITIARLDAETLGPSLR